MKSNSQILRVKHLCEMLSVSRATIYRWTGSGLLPPRRRIGPNVVGWLAQDIEEFLSSRPLASSSEES